MWAPRKALDGGVGRWLTEKARGGPVGGHSVQDCVVCPRSREESGRSLCPKPSESGPASVPLTPALQHGAWHRAGVPTCGPQPGFWTA